MIIEIETYSLKSNIKKKLNSEDREGVEPDTNQPCLVMLLAPRLERPPQPRLQDIYARLCPSSWDFRQVWSGQRSRGREKLLKETVVETRGSPPAGCRTFCRLRAADLCAHEFDLAVCVPVLRGTLVKWLV